MADAKDPAPSLHLNALREGGRPGMTGTYGGALAEAAAVCLEERLHTSGVCMKITGQKTFDVCVEWDPTNEQQRKTWADEPLATEHGAYGCAILVVEHVTGLRVTSRARKGTGFDWWLGCKSGGDELFQNKARLEVSGIRSGDEKTLARRVTKKKQQTEQSDQSVPLPAWAVVVEFSEPQTRAVER